MEVSMKLLVKKENQIFRKAVLHIEGCGEVIVKCVSAQRFSSTMIRVICLKNWLDEPLSEKIP
jgi:hypothetical protein